MAKATNGLKKAPLYFLLGDRQGVVNKVDSAGVEVTWLSWLSGEANGGALLPLSVLKDMELFANSREFEQVAKAHFERFIR